MIPVAAYVHDDPRWFAFCAPAAPAGLTAAACAAANVALAGAPIPAVGEKGALAATPPVAAPAGNHSRCRVAEARALIGGYRRGEGMWVQVALDQLAAGDLGSAALYLRDAARYADTDSRRAVFQSARALLLVEIEERSAQAGRL